MITMSRMTHPLQATCRQCNPTLLSNQCSSWAGIASAALVRDQPRTQAVCIDVLAATLDCGRRDPELRRELSSDQLPGILASLLAMITGKSAAAGRGGGGGGSSASSAKQTPATTTPIANIVAAYKMIGVCATIFPGPTRPFAGRVRAAVAAGLDAALPEVVHAAAACYACLPRCAGQKTLSQTWSESTGAVLGSLHDIVGALFTEVDEEGPCSGLESPASNSVAQFPQRYTRARACVCVSVCLF